MERFMSSSISSPKSLLVLTFSSGEWKFGVAPPSVSTDAIGGGCGGCGGCGCGGGGGGDVEVGDAFHGAEDMVAQKRMQLGNVVLANRSEQVIAVNVDPRKTISIAIG